MEMGQFLPAEGFDQALFLDRLVKKYRLWLAVACFSKKQVFGTAGATSYAAKATS